LCCFKAAAPAAPKADKQKKADAFHPAAPGARKVNGKVADVGREILPPEVIAKLAKTAPEKPTPAVTITVEPPYSVKKQASGSGDDRVVQYAVYKLGDDLAIEVFDVEGTAKEFAAKMNREAAKAVTA
jgi:hypothetical protein